MDLLDLPAEILFNIWSSSIGTTTIAITARDLLAGDTSRIDVLNNGGLQLLQICKQIRAEALPLLADRTMLVIDCVKKLPSPFRPKVTLWAEFFQRLGYIRLQKGEVLNNQNHPILRIEDISNRFPNLKYLDFDVDELGFTVAELPYTTGELQELLAEPDNLITTINEYLCDRVSRLLDNIERPWGHLGGLIQKLDRNYQILVRQVLLSGSNYWNGLSGSSWYIAATFNVDTGAVTWLKYKLLSGRFGQDWSEETSFGNGWSRDQDWTMRVEPITHLQPRVTTKDAALEADRRRKDRAEWQRILWLKWTGMLDKP